MTSALVVGGTGPTGVPVVNGLLARGAEVAIFHTGAHPAEFDGPVERIVGDPRDPASIAGAVGARRWDLAICTSGRLRELARLLAGRVGRLVAVTGQPVYAGSLRPTPDGVLALPVPESAPVQDDAKNYTGKVAAGEAQVLAQHAAGDFEAVVVRYPGVYGPRSYLAHEWAVVKRVLDRRRFMILPHDGATYFQRGYVDNLARLVLLAAEVPGAAGLIVNAGDEQVLSARAVAVAVTEALGAELELVGMPARWCPGVYPLAEKSSLVLDLARARCDLGYRDVVGVEEATRRTACWLAEHPPAAGEVPEAFAGTFDYAREDLLRTRFEEVQRLVTVGGDDGSAHVGRPARPQVADPVERAEGVSHA